MRLLRVHTPKRSGLRPLAAACWLICAAQPTVAQPVGAQAVVGTVQLSQPSNQLLQVHTTNGTGTQHSVTNWQSFSIPSGHTTQILQPSPNSLSINRVVGPDPSHIWGQLRSNGQVLLVNPAGITVGAGAVVDTAGFAASALHMSQADAVLNRWRFEGGGGAVQANGQIKASLGDITLVGAQVATGPGGVLTADQGAVRLAAGQSVDVTGPGLDHIHLRITAPEHTVANLSRLQGGAVGLFAHHLRHSGAIQTQAVQGADGRVVLRAVDSAQVSGSVRAQGSGGLGGSVQITGQTVALTDGALVDASGARGGGEVLVGGGWQGQDSRLVNAQGTRVDGGVLLKADASERGDGGTVVVWSDVITGFSGRASAMGGPLGGNGGRIEISGKQALAYRGTASTLAPLGMTGWLLLDPADIYIVDNAGQAPAGATDGSGLLSGLLVLLGLASEVYVLTTDVEAALASNNVSILTNFGILNSGDIHVLGNLDWTSNTRLELNASRNILLDAVIRPAGTTGGVDLVAANNIVQQAGGLVDLSTAVGLTLNATANSIGAAGASNALHINLNPLATGISANLTANSEGVYVRQATGTLDTGRYQVTAGNNQAVTFVSGGDIAATSVTALSGASGANLTLAATGGVALNPGVGGTFRSVTITAGGGSGVSMGTGAASNWSASNGLGIQATAGSINLGTDLANTSATNNATLALSAGNNILAAGLATQGGALTLQAGTTSVGSQVLLSNTATTRSSALPAPDGSAGTINIAVGSGGTASTQLLQTASANVVVTAPSGVSISQVDTQGNSGNLDAGAVTLTASGGTGVVVDTILAQGQAGGASQAGGRGGNVQIQTAGTGALTTTINTSGGAGGDATAAGLAGGNGGDAGTITIQHPGALVLGGSLLAHSGDAGSALTSPTTAAGGTPGNAQAVNVTAGSGLTLGALTVDNTPGNAGLDNLGSSGPGAGMQATVLTAGTGNLLQTGALNLNGQILRFSSGASVTLDNAGNNIGETDGTATGSVGIVGLSGVGDLGVTAGTTLDLLTPAGTLAIQGSLSAGGAISLQGATVSIHDPVTSGSSVGISATTAINILTPAAGGSGTGNLIANTLTLTAPTTNLHGTLTPGASGAIGTATVNGVLNLQNGSVLNLDFNGTSHDTVTTTGGFTAVAGVTVNAQAGTAPTAGSYTLVNGTHSGTVPNLTSNISGATLGWGSLLLTVPGPAPTPAPTPVPAPAGGSGGLGSSALDGTLYSTPAWSELWARWNNESEGANLDDQACRPL